MANLSGAQLIEQKKIFEQNLVREVLAWIRHNQDIIGNRATRLPGATEKLIAYTTKTAASLLGVAGAASAMPSSGAGAGLSLGAIGIDVVGSAITVGINHHYTKRIRKLAEFTATDANNVIEVCLRQFAKAASLRYEYLLAVKLSENPRESVIPLARVGAQRVIDYLQRNIEQDTELSFLQDSDWVLDGLLQGRSGRGHENIWANNSLVAKADNTINDNRKLTVEGALGRSAMRDITNLAGPIYYHPDITTFNHRPDDTSMIRKREKLLSPLRKLGHKIKGDSQSPNYGPKYGAMLVDEYTRQRYGYSESFNTSIMQDKAYAYQPQVFLATKSDVNVYLTYKQPNQSFLAYIQQQYPHISEAWVEKVSFEDELIQDADFSGVNFSRCEFNRVKFKNVNMSGVNFTFVKASNATFENVNFTQANFSFASFENNVKFNPPSCTGALWLGANLAGLEDTTVTKFTELEEKQQQLADAMRTEFDTVYAELNRIEQAQANKLSLVENKIDKHTEELDELTQKSAEQAAQLVNTLAYQKYCEIELNILKVNDLHQQEKIEYLEQEVGIMKKQSETLREETKQFDIHLRHYDIEDATIEKAVTIKDNLTDSALMNIYNDEFDKAMEVLSTQSIKMEHGHIKGTKVNAEVNIVNNTSKHRVFAREQQNTPHMIDLKSAFRPILNNLPEEQFSEEQEENLHKLLTQKTSLDSDVLDEIIKEEGSLDRQQKRYLRDKFHELEQKHSSPSPLKAPVVSGLTYFQLPKPISPSNNIVNKASEAAAPENETLKKHA